MNLLQKKKRLYTVWQSMKARCSNIKNRDYSAYGMRGISVCNDWELFSNFFDWAVNNGYKPGLSIDRIDFNGNYCPENCRFVTAKEQARNKRSNIFVIVDGIKLCRTDAFYKLKADGKIPDNLSLDTMRERMRAYNWSFDQAISEPPRDSSKKIINGMCLKDACRAAGIGYNNVKYRISAGVPIEYALTHSLTEYRAKLDRDGV